MSYSPIISERPRSTAVARATEPSLGSIEDATVRLRSWAAIRGVAPSGSPFLRLAGDTTLVCLPTASAAGPHPETGAIVTTIEPGDVAIVQGVAFGEISRVVAEVARDLGLEGEGLTAEFQRGPEGFGTGSLVIPLGAAARSALAAAGG